MGVSPKFQCLLGPLIAAVTLWSGSAAATITFVAASGASHVRTVSTTSTGTTVNKTYIYAGFAGSCNSMDGTNPCNSCVGDTSTSGGVTYQMRPCNFKNAYPALKLYLELTVANSSITSATDLLVKIDDNDISADATFTYTGTTLAVSVPWSAICAGGGSNANCTTDFSKNLKVGFQNIGGNSSSTDTLDIPVRTRYIAADATPASVDNWVYTDCPPGTTGVDNQGYCHFEAYKGDAKIYADALAVPGTYPTSPNNYVDFTDLVFFYAPKLQSDADEAATLARIRNNSSYTSFSVNTTNNATSDNRITGLENGTTYCFIMGSQDASGVISFFTPTTGTGALTATTLCGTPEKVVGLLDDKSCFIATAAFGSDMAPEVQSFRDFRNQYLFSNPVGKEFVRFYYKHSPYYANLIKHSDVARGFVRAGLWPLLVFAKLSVAYGLTATLFLFALVFGGVPAYCYRRKRREV